MNAQNTFPIAVCAGASQSLQKGDSVKVRIKANDSNKKNLYTLLKEQGILLPHPCNLAGKCGKCLVNTEPFGPKLACQWVPTSEVVVDTDSIIKANEMNGNAIYQNNSYHFESPTLFIDLGTTTIAMILLDTDGTQLRKETFANPGIRYGDDVIARMKASNDGFLKEIQTDLISSLEEHAKHFPLSLIKECYLAGNTVMIHLLFGEPCNTLAVAPFKPHSLDEKQLLVNHCQVFVMPGLSAFIGGDIVSGLYSLSFHERKDTCLFLDLGTNGELALLNKGKITTASVAAGPAFEGGCLSCGCQGIPGAITDVSLGRLRPKLTTIDNKLPIGLCGTGALQLCTELIHQQYVSVDGIIEDSFPTEGLVLGYQASSQEAIRFTREDFRQLQLALASIKAGIRALLHQEEVTSSDIKHVYLAGGFGYELSKTTIESLHIFPENLSNVTECIGNSSLSGLVKYAAFKDQHALSAIKNQATTFDLANDSFYKSMLIQCMSFDELDISDVQMK